MENSASVHVDVAECTARGCSSVNASTECEGCTHVFCVAHIIETHWQTDAQYVAVDTTNYASSSPTPTSTLVRTRDSEWRTDRFCTDCQWAHTTHPGVLAPGQKYEFNWCYFVAPLVWICTIGGAGLACTNDGNCWLVSIAVLIPVTIVCWGLVAWHCCKDARAVNDAAICHWHTLARQRERAIDHVPRRGLIAMAFSCPRCSSKGQ